MPDAFGRSWPAGSRRRLKRAESDYFGSSMALKRKPSQKQKCFLEVKNVTLVRQDSIAEFPDAITSRGTKHLRELINAKKKGYESYILYLIQRDDCKSFKIAEDIDREYKKTFDTALKSGVKILCYDCKLNNEEIIINNQIYYEK